MKLSFKKIAAFVLCAVLLLQTVAFSTAASENDIVSAIYGLKVNSTSSPVGIDTNPVFAWKINCGGYGKSQTAYWIKVSSTRDLAENGRGDMWNSGKVSGENNYSVEYAGEPLNSKSVYYWTVEVWDETDTSLGISEVSSFSTGIFNDSEWEGQWISYPFPKYDINLDGCSWIWRRNGAAFESSAGGTQYFRRTFETDKTKTAESVIIGFSADDRAQLYFNGEPVGKTESWSNGAVVSVTDSLNSSGQNTVAVAATNGSTGYAGMIAKVVIRYTDGSEKAIATDKSWRVSTAEYSDWFGADYDDSAWVYPDQSVAYGSSPWNSGVSLEAAGSRVAPLFRKDFSVTKTVSSAYAYVSGLGMFDLKINGANPDDSVMNPANTQYNKTVPYRTFDVTALIRQGENAIGAELGNGFFNETGGAWNWANAEWRDNPKLLLNLEITYSDGTSEIISTDTDWKTTADAPTVANSIYYGETYDARREQTGFDMPGFDDSAWVPAVRTESPGGKLSCQIIDPMRRTAEISPESITDFGNGTFLIKASEMTTGWIKLNVKAPASTEITIDYSERLNADGSIMKLGGGQGVDGNWSSGPYTQHDKYIAKGEGTETFEPKFSYKGFEYIQIENYPGTLTADDFTIYRVNSDVDIVSEFSTSDEMINSLHAIMQRTMLNNFQGKPTDTPVYEKNGWLGDANVALTSMMYNFDMSNYLPNFIEIMEDCWNTYGTVPSMVPTAGAFVENCYVWNTIFVNGVDALLNYCGDMSYAKEQYDVMREFILKDVNEIRNNGWVGQDGGFADWAGPVGGTDPDAASNWNISEGAGICGTGFVYAALKEIAALADRLGKTADAEEYRSAMADIYTAFNEKFYNLTEGIYETTVWNQIGTRTKYRQTSNLVPLAFGLVAEENVGAVVANLVEDIKSKNYHLDTGIVGTSLILPVLNEYGYADVAYKILTQTTYPSWGHWLKMGATSTWEGYENTVRSFGHYFHGTYDEFLFSGLAGVRDIADGYKTFTVDPDMTGDLNYVSMTTETLRGALESSWSLNDDGTATMKITVPFGSEAKVYFPTARIINVKIDGAHVSTDIPGVAETGKENGKAFAKLESGSYIFITQTENTPIFKDTLQAAVDEAKNYIQSDYIPKLWEPFVVALENAKSVYEDSSSKQKQVNDAVSALESAIAALNGSESRNNLKALIKEVESENIDYSLYNPTDSAALLSALITARSLAFNYNYEDEAGFNEARSILQSAFTKIKKAGSNLALGKKASASTSGENSGWSWGIKNINDGDRKNANPYNEYAGYTSEGKPSADSVEWVSVDLGEISTFNTVNIYGSCGSDLTCYLLPVDFEIQVSDDNSSWTTVHSEKGYEVRQYAPLSLKFEETEARYVRLYATKLRAKPSEPGTYRMQLTELEIYESGTAEKVDYLLGLELSDDYFINPVFYINTHGYTAAVGEATQSIAVKPTATSGSEIMVNGKIAADGAFTDKIPLNYGENKITVKVGETETVLTVIRAGNTVLGDVDADGKITVSDVVQLRKIIIAGSPTAGQKESGDIDKDGNLTVYDVVTLRKMIMAA
ncbi:MAG: family 78 glycoside hydrolase catalytic domain [Candidatus Howiella sp.]|jgi:hypothetical protein